MPNLEAFKKFDLAGFQGTNFKSNHEEYENILQLSNKKIILKANGSQSLILSNDELCSFFQCSTQGGMRRSRLPE